MACPVVHLGEMEKWVCWVEETPPDTIVEEASGRLLRGTSERVLLVAGALAAARSIDPEARDTHGYVSHALMGINASRSVAAWLNGVERALPLIQALYQVSLDIRNPHLGPFRLLVCGSLSEGDQTEVLASFRQSIVEGDRHGAEHYLMNLVEIADSCDLLKILYEAGLQDFIGGYHKVIMPMHVGQLIDAVGWQYAPVLLRAPVRFIASWPKDREAYRLSLEVARLYGLHKILLGTSHHPGQMKQEQMLREELLIRAAPDAAELVASTLASGLSLRAVGRSIALAGTDLFLRISPGVDPIGPLHLNTSINALRCIVQRVDRRLGSLALIQAAQRISHTVERLGEEYPGWKVPAYPRPEDLARVGDIAPAALLAEMCEAIESGDVGRATACVARYGECGLVSAPLISTLAHIAARDDATTLHGLKFHQAMTAEFCEGHSPANWVHLIAVAKFAAWYAPRRGNIADRWSSSLQMEDIGDEVN